MTTKELLESTSIEDFKSFIVDKKEYYKTSTSFLGFELVDLKKESYGYVNEVKEKLSEGNILEFISFVSGHSYTKVLGSDSKEFIEFFLHILNEVDNIVLIEDGLNDLRGDYEDKEEAYLEQAGVSRLNKFGVFGVLDELSGGDITKHKEISEMPYEYVFTKLLRDKEKSIVQSNYNGIQRERSK